MSDETPAIFGRGESEKVKAEEARWAKMMGSAAIVDVKEDKKKKPIDLSKFNPDQQKKLSEAQKILEQREKKEMAKK
jgi:hypothetical protein